MDETLQQWFIREIVPHEPALVRLMSRLWPDRHEVADLRQEIYIRVYEAAARSRPTNPKSFLFATARHLVVDRVRRNKVVSVELKGDLEGLNLLIDEVSPEQNVGARQELRRLAGAFELLPAQCRDVMWLRKVENLSQKEVALRLGMKEKAVEKRLARGVRLLAESFYAVADGDARGTGALVRKEESGHG